MIKHLYFCDRCGMQQEKDRVLWRISVKAVDPNTSALSDYHRRYEQGLAPWKGDVHWCKPCVDACGLFTTPLMGGTWDEKDPSVNAAAIEELVSSIMNQNIRLDCPPHS